MSLPVSAKPIPLAPDSDGVIRVSQTRVSLDSVAYAFNDGATAEEIVQQYPSLPLADVYAVIGYYLQNRDAVEAYLHERQQQRQQIRQQNEARFDPQGVRDRLLRRQKKKA